MARKTHSPVARTVFRGGRSRPGAGKRALPEEVALALTFNGTTHAVMMGTPADLEDFAAGFALTEGIVEAAGEIERIEPVAAGAGIDIQVRLAARAGAAFSARRRHMAGPVGCGLCGLDSIAEALRPVARIAVPCDRPVLGPEAVAAAVAALAQAQPLHGATHAVHAAGFFYPARGLLAAREDIGRHNALDKLAGALARGRVEAGRGALVITSRVSIDMVQKAARIGAPVLIAVSAPTALAVAAADTAGITLAALARGEDFELFTHAGRIADAPSRAGTSLPEAHRVA